MPDRPHVTPLWDESAAAARAQGGPRGFTEGSPGGSALRNIRQASQGKLSQRFLRTLRLTVQVRYVAWHAQPQCRLFVPSCIVCCSSTAAAAGDAVADDDMRHMANSCDMDDKMTMIMTETSVLVYQKACGVRTTVLIPCNVMSLNLHVLQSPQQHEATAWQFMELQFTQHACPEDVHLVLLGLTREIFRERVIDMVSEEQ